MAFEIIDTYELIGTIDEFEPVTTYWLDLCFPNAHYSQSEKIYFDLIDKAKRLAPFVMPNVQGQPMLARAESIRVFSPAYIKPKDAIDPARLVRRRAGERFGGELSLQEREDAIVADTLQDHRDMITRRWEWMACEAVTKGQVTVYGENYPSATVGFGRRAENTKTLTGTAAWTTANAATSAPVTNIQSWAIEMQRTSSRRLQRVTMTPAALAGFLASNQVKGLLETRRGSGFTLESGAVNGENAYRVGVLPEGGVEIWSYYETYEDNMGVEVPYVADGNIVLTGAVEGVRAFGAIMDKKAGWQSLAMFPKMWEQEDPSGLFLMTQSAPLMIPGRPNASMLIDVNG